MEDISGFIKKIEAEIEELQAGVMQAETNYRDIPEWSSMHALILIALSETEYNVSLSGEDLRKCNTVQDLYDLIKSRIS